jgi:hypothetical protein
MFKPHLCTAYIERRNEYALLLPDYTSDARDEERVQLNLKELGQDT